MLSTLMETWEKGSNSEWKILGELCWIGNIWEGSCYWRTDNGHLKRIARVFIRE